MTIQKVVNEIEETTTTYSKGVITGIITGLSTPKSPPPPPMEPPTHYAYIKMDSGETINLNFKSKSKEAKADIRYKNAKGEYKTLNVGDTAIFTVNEYKTKKGETAYSTKISLIKVLKEATPEQVAKIKESKKEDTPKKTTSYKRNNFDEVGMKTGHALACADLYLKNKNKGSTYKDEELLQVAYIFHTITEEYGNSYIKNNSIAKEDENSSRQMVGAMIKLVASQTKDPVSKLSKSVPTLVDGLINNVQNKLYESIKTGVQPSTEKEEVPHTNVDVDVDFDDEIPF